ncbi:MAG TPA: outer-membrane lipoprotein carrier protein LolA [Thermoanaerobaculia bacterium]|nr:outer-membrane lipoprotein carrier protein LolA [Thermoanaerobaculia bacterium]
MTTPHLRPAFTRFLSLSAAFCLFLPALAGAAGSPDPWSVLQGVRQSLVAAGPTGAQFVQVYIPAGFTSGEQETGELALALPDCLRWDYQNPYPKSFLLCGGLVHFWNPEDKTGRRYAIDRQKEPGLDLLLLGVDDLKGRYQATAKQGEAGVEVSLSPKRAVAPSGVKGEELADANFVVDPATQRLVQVSYHDRQGNLTRFEIKSYRPLGRRGQFSPPGGIRWED